VHATWAPCEPQARARAAGRFDASQMIHTPGQRANSTTQVILVSSASPRAIPAPKAAGQSGRLSQRQNAYHAPAPRAAAPTSGVIIWPLAITLGQKHHSVRASSPAPGPYRSRAHARQIHPPSMLSGMQAQRASVKSQKALGPLTATKSRPTGNSLRTLGLSE